MPSRPVRTSSRAMRRTPRRRRLRLEVLETRRLLTATSPSASGSLDPGTSDSGSNGAGGDLVLQIVDGDQAPFYPHVGLLSVTSQSNGFCTGTLITRQHVLTAGHCVDLNNDGIPDKGFYFRTGQNANVFDGGKVFKVIDTFRHPDYFIHQVPHPTDPGKKALKSIRNDIAVLKLETLVLDGVPAKRVASMPPVPFVGEVVGFGRLGSTQTGLLQDNGRVRYHGAVAVDSIGSDDGVGSPTNTLSWDLDQVNESNTAPGDSGGPTFVHLPGQPPLIVGVHSYGDTAAARIGARSHDERVDVHAGWIDSILALDSTGPDAEVDWSNDITEPGRFDYNVRVTYTDVNGIQQGQLNTPHIAASGPNNYFNSRPEIGLVITNPDRTRMTVDYRFRGPGGHWAAKDNGTYRVTLLNDGLVDGAGNPTGVSQIATFRVSLPPDQSRPQASGTFRDVTAAGPPHYNLTIRYEDDFAVDGSTLGNNDVVVVRQGGGYQVAARLLTGNDVRDATTLNALYQITPPGGSWDSSDNGQYVVYVRENSVRDTGGNGVSFTQAGSFHVNIPVGGPRHPYATLNPSDVYSETRNLRFSITYRDDGQVNASTITADDFDVFVQPAAGAVGDFADLVSISPTGNAGTITATYEVDLFYNWTAADNGIPVTVQLFGSAVRDTAGNAVPSGIVGQFKIKIGAGGPDTNSPQAFIEASNLTLPGNQRHPFAVTFADDNAVNASTITSNSLFVLTPDDQLMEVDVTQINYGQNTPLVTAAFGLDAPGGTWGSEDNGLYKVVVRDGTISDTSGNFLPGHAETDVPPGGELTSFMVAIESGEEPVPVSATLHAETLRAESQAYHEFDVTYAHEEGIDVSLIGDDDLIVTGNNEFAAFAEFVSLDVDSNGSPRTATYRIAAPGDVWTEADNGTYEVHSASATIGTVGSVAGNVLPAGILGAFEVAVGTEPDPLDYGDAPTAAQSGFAGDYPVTREQDGARHMAGSLRLGSLVDVEPDGQPDATAGRDGQGGDDQVDQSDEDGVRVLATLVATSDTSVQSTLAVTSSAAGRVDAWIDFNRDGDWDDDREQVFESLTVDAGINLFPVLIPPGASHGDTAARFRLSSQGGLAPTGLADDGEVEDHFLTIADGQATGGAPVAVELPSGGTVDLFVLNDNLTVTHDSLVMFRGPVAALQRVDLLGSPGDDVLRLRPIDADAEARIGFDARDGNDSLVLIGTGHVLDLRNSAGSDWQGIETIDLRGQGPNSLVLNEQAVRDLSATTDELVLQHDHDDTLVYDGVWRVASPEFSDGQYHHVLNDSSSNAVIRIINDRAWQNPLLPLDVNRDGVNSSNDVLRVINAINSGQAGSLPDPADETEVPSNYYDTNGDRFLSPGDVLRVINYLNTPAGASEGEGLAPQSPGAADTANSLAIIPVTEPRRYASTGVANRPDGQVAIQRRTARTPLVSPHALPRHAHPRHPADHSLDGGSRSLALAEMLLPDPLDEHIYEALFQARRSQDRSVN